MAHSKPTRRNLILGTGAAAAIAATAPTVGILSPQQVLAAAKPDGTHRGPAHDWLDDFVARKLKGGARG